MVRFYNVHTANCSVTFLDVRTWYAFIISLVEKNDNASRPIKHNLECRNLIICLYVSRPCCLWLCQ